MATTRTNLRGEYAVRGISTRGRYRSVATLGEATVSSSPVVAGPGTRVKA